MYNKFKGKMSAKICEGNRLDSYTIYKTEIFISQYPNVFQK